MIFFPWWYNTISLFLFGLNIPEIPFKADANDCTSQQLFLRVKSEVPDFRSKISVIPGDVGAPDLGLSPTDRSLLTGKVNMIFHGAATVRFDENIKTAVGINTRGVQAMLTLAREMEHLKVRKIITIIAIWK